jgi:hypothetical protein
MSSTVGSVERRASPSERDLAGLAADGLTLMRLVLAAALVPVLGARRIVLAAAMVGSAWLTDFFDGRAARASAGPTSLGALDLWAETLVGAGAVLGFVGSGRCPPSRVGSLTWSAVEGPGDRMIGQPGSSRPARLVGLSSLMLVRGAPFDRMDTELTNSVGVVRRRHHAERHLARRVVVALRPVKLNSMAP